MTDEQRRRIDDHRPAVGLQWDENNPPPRTPIERPEQWTILLTSGNHGLVGSYGHTFPHAEGDHERINVVDEAVVIKLRERIRELQAAGNTNKAVLTDEQIKDLSNANRGPRGILINDISFARAIEAAVLANASKAAVAEPGKLGEPVPEHILEAIREYGDLRADGKASSTVQMANIILAMRRHYRAAPAPADNPSTAGAVKGGNTSLDYYDAGLLNDYGGGNVEWWQDYIRSVLGAAHDFYQSQVDSSIAAPALNPSDVRDQALEEAALAVQSLGDVNPPMSFGIRCAAAIRALKRAAAQSVESSKGNLGDNDIDGDAAVPAYYGL